MSSEKATCRQVNNHSQSSVASSENQLETMKKHSAINGQSTRREFLGGMALALGGAGACLIPTLSGAASLSNPSIRFPSEPRQRICVSSYSFREFIAGEH